MKIKVIELVIGTASVKSEKKKKLNWISVTKLCNFMYSNNKYIDIWHNHKNYFSKFGPFMQNKNSL